ncbi:hypothetical protein G0Q06_03450 [Puniceicoccales bacterium CK1056]|uniref:Uncharacterized protein n=1 Tax=Oceanipulchritudo coccoides TaxID=2706888 RepID=A0A6B2LZM5_9BACT|nr:hypothetical protein [Oceanipulchritudo coccoides]NDV61499.1 hypothetical protein [Oceanipulchritudo coccoides]
MKNPFTPMVGLCAALFLVQPLVGQVTTNFNDLAPDYEPDPIGNPGVFVMDHRWSSALNWDNGLPVAGDTANVGGTFLVETGGGDLNLLDGLTANFSGSATYSSAGLRLDDAVLTFSDSSSWVASGGLAFGRDGATSSVIVNWDSTGTLTPSGTNLLIGRVDDATLNQTTGTVGDPVVGIRIGTGALNSGSGTYNLSGGSAVGLELIFEANLGAQTFNYTSGSTGQLIISNFGLDYTNAIQAFIDSGNITVAGVAQTPGDYSAFTIAYSGTDTTVSLSGYAGPAPVNFNDGEVADSLWTSPLNWDSGVVPTTGDIANVGLAYAVVTGGGDVDVLDGVTTNISGTAILSSSGIDLDDAVVTFSQGSAWNDGVTVTLGKNVGATSATLDWISTGTFTPTALVIGEGSDGTINQTGGTVGSATVPLQFGSGAGNSGNGTYNLWGGTVSASTLVFTANLGSHAFNFPPSSTGTLVVANGGADYTAALQGFIDSGKITVDGAAYPGNYALFNIVYSGTETSISFAGFPGPPPIVFNDLAPDFEPDPIGNPGVFVEDHDWASALNWVGGVVPVSGDTAQVGSSFTVVTGGGDLSILDGITTNFIQNAHYDSAGLRLDNALITFSGASTWTAGGAIALGRDDTGQPATEINWNSSGSFIPGGLSLLLGRKSDGIFNQTAGTVGVPSVGFQFGVGSNNNGGGTYNLSGGTAVCSSLVYTTNGGTHAFNFPAGSTGKLVVVNAGLDYTTDLQGFIDAGLITIDGVAQTPGDYSAFAITYDTADTKSIDSIQDIAGTLQIGWFGELGRVYSVESSATLAAPWTSLNRTWTGAGADITANVGSLAPGEKIFYRQVGVTVISLAP